MIKNLMNEVQHSSNKKICVTLKCVAGAHLGQKFRLEPAGVMLSPSPLPDLL